MFKLSYFLIKRNSLRKYIFLNNSFNFCKVGNKGFLVVFKKNIEYRRKNFKKDLV